MRKTRSGWIFALMVALLVTGRWASAAEDAASQPASRPASQPASEIVLVRIGGTVITQEDFNADAWNVPPARVALSKAFILREMISRRLFLLYAREYPEIVDPAVLEMKIAEAAQEQGVKNRQELEAKLKAENRLRAFDDFLDRNRAMIARVALVERARKNADDDNYLRQMFDKDPLAFNGTRMKVRQIVMRLQPWDTPARIQAQREKAARIREDLVSGRKTWDQVIGESDDVSSRIIGGDLGYVPRHLEKPEPLAKAVFAIKPGETSDVVESPDAFYVLQVTAMNKGTFDFEQAKVWMRSWVQREPLFKADAEMRAKHPVIGVREPDLPPPHPMPEVQTAPKSQPRRAVATAPSSVRRAPTTMPARKAQQRSTTRPVRGPTATRPAGKR